MIRDIVTEFALLFSLSPFFPPPLYSIPFHKSITSKLTFSSVITSRTNFIYEFDTIFITIINKKKKVLISSTRYA